MGYFVLVYHKKNICSDNMTKGGHVQDIFKKQNVSIHKSLYSIWKWIREMVDKEASTKGLWFKLL